MEEKYLKGCPLTIFLAAVNAAVYMAQIIMPELEMKLALIPLFVSEGEHYRMVTTMFTHSSPEHLGGNIIAIIALGPLLEKNIHRFKYLIIYFLSGLCGSILVLVTSDPWTMTVGASGAIWGLMAASAMEMYKIGDRKRLLAVLANVAINVVSTFTSPNISVAGHFGGLVGGFVTGLLFIGLSPKGRCPERWE